MNTTPAFTAHDRLMDEVYRRQRHVYDLTRKYYLLGRDDLIARLSPPDGGTILEIGCGTGRNLALAARRFPKARLFGIDISAEMLKTAHRQLTGEIAWGRCRLGHADAAAFTPSDLFGEVAFDRVFVSYALSMIPPWRQALDCAAACVGPGGSLHIVDFGGQKGLPTWFRSGLRSWLARFHVAPRDDLDVELGRLARSTGGRLAITRPYRDYTIQAELAMPR